MKRDKQNYLQSHVEEESRFEFDGKTITLALSGLTVIVGVLAFLLFYDGIKVNHQQRIVAYINEVNSSLAESAAHIKPLKEDMENDRSLTLTLEVEQELRKLLTAVNQLDPPEHWDNHRNVSASLVSERYLLYYHKLHGIKKEEKDSELLAKIELLEAEEMEALLSALEASNIPYKETEDGKISFSVKTY